MSDHMKRNNDNRAGKPIETASATTSPDNSDSGNFAFVLTALTLIVTIILSVVAGGVAAVVLGVAASSANGTATSMNLEMDGDIGSGDMFEEMLDQYYDEFLDEQYNVNTNNNDGTTTENTDNGEKTDQKTGVVTTSEALDFYLAPYYVTLDDDISANAYANTPVEVRDFVRNLLSTDREYSTQISTAFSDAARDSENARMHLDSAVGTCAAAIESINAIDLPPFEGVADPTVRDTLGTARTQAAHRYELIAAEIEVLKAEDGVNTEELWKKDDEVVQSAEDIANMVTSAMETAANNG
jgi:hypothetical protein